MWRKSSLSLRRKRKLVSRHGDSRFLVGFSIMSSTPSRASLDLVNVTENSPPPSTYFVQQRPLCSEENVQKYVREHIDRRYIEHGKWDGQPRPSRQRYFCWKWASRPSPKIPFLGRGLHVLRFKKEEGRTAEGRSSVSHTQSSLVVDSSLRQCNDNNDIMHRIISLVSGVLIMFKLCRPFPWNNKCTIPMYSLRPLSWKRPNSSYHQNHIFYSFHNFLFRESPPSC